MCRDEKGKDPALHARILSAAIQYCWANLEAKSHAAILDRIRLGAQEAVVIQEELVERLSTAAVQAASSAASSSDISTPHNAINLLRLLRLESRLLSSESSAQFQVSPDILIYRSHLLLI